MDWELVPGTAKLLEERLGRPGYHMGTGIALAVGCGLFLAPFGVLAVIFAGVSVAFEHRIPAATLEHTGFLLAIGCVLAIVNYGVFRYMAYRAMRKVEERTAWLNDRATEIESHMDFHATHGDHLIIAISGEDAEKQWPEIERRLWEWKRAQDGIEDEGA